MRTKNELLRPVTLEPGAACFRIEPPVFYGSAEVLPVWFVAYDPCPAYVIVRVEDGSRHRCPRDEIFIAPPQVTELKRTAPIIPARRFPAQPSLGSLR